MPKEGADITIVATSRSGGVFDFYGKLPGDNYSVYVDTAIGTVVMQFAEVNPFSIVVNELRWLWTGLPSPNHLWQAFAWVAVILLVFAPIAVQRYRRAASG